MEAVRYNLRSATSAESLVHWIGIDYADHGRVDWEQATQLRLSTSQRRNLEATFLPWLQRNFDIKQGLISWAANPETTAAGVCAKLTLFSRLTHTSLATATILRGAWDVLRVNGWRQHEPGDPNRGFDVVGAIAYYCDLHGVDVRLRVAAIDALRMYLPRTGVAENVTVTEWNDDQRHRKQDVLRMLSACAGDVETI